MSFLYEPEKFIRNNPKTNSLPIAITGDYQQKGLKTLIYSDFKGGKIKLNFALDGAKIRILIEHCQDLPTISNTAPEPYVKTYLLDAAKSKISNSKVSNLVLLVVCPYFKTHQKNRKRRRRHTERVIQHSIM